MTVTAKAEGEGQLVSHMVHPADQSGHRKSCDIIEDTARRQVLENKGNAVCDLNL